MRQSPMQDARWTLVLGFIAASLTFLTLARSEETRVRLASFSGDITIPVGHRCMGVLPIKSKEVLDPLYAHGFVLMGSEQPIVLAALDWCEVRNGSYDEWRHALADAANTTVERVLVCSLHQHDAPVIDSGAAELLSEVGLAGELFDEEFHTATVRRIAQALKDSLPDAVSVTHVGLGQARVEGVASNRRVVDEYGRTRFNRGSRSGVEAFHRRAPDGRVDPRLKTISFWHGDQPLLALHSYATHPMSNYGQGQVSSDFVGLARQRRQRDDFSIKQIYVSGCSGDVTAGKYNDGSVEARDALTGRIYDGMRAAWAATTRHPIERLSFRNAKLELRFSADPTHSESALRRVLRDPAETVEQRILAAMGLSSRSRVESRKPIDLPCVDFGSAQLILFPGETFVAYQLAAQALRPDQLVMCLGYGECWTGYIPTEAAFADGFQDKWLWVDRGSEQRMLQAMQKVLVPH